MNKICPVSLQFSRPGSEYELEAALWPRRGTNWTILQAPLRDFDIQETKASSNIFFLIKWRRQTWIWKIQLSLANLSFIDCLLNERDLVVSQRNNTVMELWNWLMVNWCFNTGKQMNIWRTPGCELTHDAVLLLGLCMCPIYTLKSSSCQFQKRQLKEMPFHLWP